VSPTASETGSPADDLDRALAELVAMPGGPPGVISIVQVGDKQTVHTAGVADTTTGAAPEATDHMRIASAAKAFSGAAALSLVDQGKLSLGDTIGKWRPGPTSRCASCSATPAGCPTSPRTPISAPRPAPRWILRYHRSSC
jgi:D-alanyl-D-alanine carboxypeptidase